VQTDTIDEWMLSTTMGQLELEYAKCELQT
jgi:hypothetical protein